MTFKTLHEINQMQRDHEWAMGARQRHEDEFNAYVERQEEIDRRYRVEAAIEDVERRARALGLR